MTIFLTVLHVMVSLVLIVVVLLQHGHRPRESRVVGVEGQPPQRESRRHRHPVFRVASGRRDQFERHILGPA